MVEKLWPQWELNLHHPYSTVSCKARQEKAVGIKDVMSQQMNIKL